MLTVPEGAVQRNDMLPFVFVQTGERKFEAKEVEVGASSGGRTAIVAGLHAGDLVVSEAAFILKSEMLLADEEE